MKYPKDIPPDLPFSPPPTFTIPKWTPSPPPSLPFIPPLVLYLTLDTKEDDAAEKVSILFELMVAVQPFHVVMRHLEGV